MYRAARRICRELKFWFCFYSPQKNFIGSCVPKNRCHNFSLLPAELMFAYCRLLCVRFCETLCEVLYLIVVTRQARLHSSTDVTIKLWCSSWHTIKQIRRGTSFYSMAAAVQEFLKSVGLNWKEANVYFHRSQYVHLLPNAWPRRGFCSSFLSAFGMDFLGDVDI